MKKNFTQTFLAIVLLICSTTATAQTIFIETFDNIAGPTAGGPGSYAFPNGWLLANVDNKTPDATVSYVKHAWERREDFNFNVADSVAFSTSYYSPTGQADDWMWTPPINLDGVFLKSLSWSAVSYDPAYPDGYEVRIMTVPPTGSNGNVGNMVSESLILFSTTAENSNWTNRKVDISAFNGKTVYIGFRNNSNDKFILAIDNIKVERLLGYDAETSAIAGYEYQQTPANQAPSIPLSATIKNLGSQNLTNLNLKAEVYNSLNTLVYAASGSSVATVAPGVSQQFTITSWVPSEPGNYTIKYFPVFAEIEQNPANDTLTKTINITDSVFARDNGSIIGSLGIGAGEVGYIGQAFTITREVYLTSVTANYTRGYTGKKYAFVLWNTTVSGIPQTIIASTDTLLYPSDNTLLTTVPVYGGKFFLTPGTYVVTAVEFDSTLALATTDQFFSPGTQWVNWPSNPLGGWANVEAFGSSFKKTFYLRLNVSTAAALPVRIITFTGTATSAGNKLQWKVGEQSGIQKYVIERSSDGIYFKSIGSVDANNQITYSYQFNDKDVFEGINFYRIKIIEISKENYSNIIRIDNKKKYETTLSPMPAKNFVILQSGNSKLLNTYAILQTIDGKVMRHFRIDQLPFTIDLSNFAKGMYFLQLNDKSVLKIIKE